MSSGKKDFDAVASMRAIRDRLSAEIDGMTFEEELSWLASRPLTDPFLKRLQEKGCPTTSCTGRRAQARLILGGSARMRSPRLSLVVRVQPHYLS